jgi:hypothetical protein
MQVVEVAAQREMLLAVAVVPVVLAVLEMQIHQALADRR